MAELQENTEQFEKVIPHDHDGVNSPLLSTASTKARCRVYRGTSDQTIGSGSYSKIQFNATSFDTTSSWDSTNYRFTAPRDGKYLIACTLYMEVTTTGSLYSMTFNIDGSATYSSRNLSYSEGNGNQSYFHTDVLELSQGETLEVQFNQSSGGNKNILFGEADSFVSITEL